MKKLREKIIIMMFLLMSIFFISMSFVNAIDYFNESCSTNISKYIFYEDFESGIINDSIWVNSSASSINSTNAYSGSYSLKCNNVVGVNDCLKSINTYIYDDVAVEYYFTNEGTNSVIADTIFLDRILSNNYLISLYNGVFTNVWTSYDDSTGWVNLGIGKEYTPTAWTQVRWYPIDLHNFAVNITNSTFDNYNNVLYYTQNDISFPSKIQVTSNIGNIYPDEAIYWDKIMIWNRTTYGDLCPYDCYTDWIDNSTECNGLNYTIIYYDNSNCDTLENLPISNGSIVSCSFENWVRITKPCNYGTRLIEYYDTLNSNLTYYLPVNNNTYENCTLESTITFNSKSVIFTLTELDLLYYIIIGILIYFPFYMNNKKYFALYIFVGIILGIYTIYLESKLLDIFIENTFFVNLIKWILLSISLSFFAYGILQGWSNLMDMIFGEKDSKGMRKK